MTRRRRTISARTRPAQARSAKAHRVGFTLIEVLCALVLIGVVLPVAMRGVTLSLAAATRARHTGEAGELARAKLGELSMLADASGYTGTGDFGTDWPDYTWSSTATTRDWGVTEVTVTVKWKSRGTEESLSLATLTYPGSLTTGTTTTTTTDGGTQ